MKKWIYVLLLCCIGDLGFIELEGGSDGFLMLRNPFNPPYACPTVTIYSPVEGATYYNNNVLLNFSTVGATECFYRTSGSWNTIPCQYNDTRTFTEGEVTLVVRAAGPACTTYTSVNFEVVLFHHGVLEDQKWVLIGVFITSGSILLIIAARRKKKRYTP